MGRRNMNVGYLALNILLTLMLLTGDYLIKFATTSQTPIRFLIGAAFMWTASIYGWYCVVAQQGMVVTGILFAMLSLIGTTLIGIVSFGEKLNMQEWAGFILAILATALLVKR
jgi:drug/metabolite transporter (DMT)-like permease